MNETSQLQLLAGFTIMIKIREQTLSSQDDAIFMDLYFGLHMPIHTSNNLQDQGGWAPGELV